MVSMLGAYMKLLASTTWSASHCAKPAKDATTKASAVENKCFIGVDLRLNFPLPTGPQEKSSGGVNLSQEVLFY